MSNIICINFLCPHCGKKLSYQHREKYVDVTALCLYCKKRYRLIWDIKRPLSHVVKSINYKKSHERWNKRGAVK